MKSLDALAFEVREQLPIREPVTATASRAIVNLNNEVVFDFGEARNATEALGRMNGELSIPASLTDFSQFANSTPPQGVFLVADEQHLYVYRTGWPKWRRTPLASW